MNWFRKVLVAFFALVLFFAAINIAWSFSITHNFGNPDTVKGWLTDSKIYDNAVSAVLNSTQNDNDKNGSDGSISLKDPVVQQAAIAAFSPQLLQSSVNTFIDSNYDWLKGKTATPEFKIDLAKAKEDFATKVGTAVETRLAGLTVCTAQQQALLQIPVVVTTVSCRPSNLDPKTEGARVANEIRNSDFLSKPVITADTLAHDSSNTNSKPYYVQASKLPEAYQASQKAPIALGLIALISILAIIFIASPRRKGWRRIASVLLVAGILLIASKFAADMGVSRVEREIAKSKTVVSQLKDPSNDLIEHVARSLTQTNMYIGMGYVITSLVIYSVLFKTKDNNDKKPRFTSGAGKGNNPVDTPDTPAPERPAPPVDPTGSTEKPTGAPVFKTPKPTPVRKSPKPPRLVQ